MKPNYYLYERIIAKGNSTIKHPEVRICLTCSRNIKESSMDRIEWKGERIKGGEMNEVAGESAHLDPYRPLYKFRFHSEWFGGIPQELE